jgi:hypothetical protein
VKIRFYIVTAVTCAAIGTPVAQAHLEGSWSYGAAVKSTSSLKYSSSQTTLAAMRAAGINYHATAGKASQSGVRPDDRSGPRGI